MHAEGGVWVMVTPPGKDGCSKRKKLSNTSRPLTTLGSTRSTLPICIPMVYVLISLVSPLHLLMVDLGIRENFRESHQAIQLAPWRDCRFDKGMKILCSLKQIITYEYGLQVYFTVAHTLDEDAAMTAPDQLDQRRYVNQRGLSRKVGSMLTFCGGVLNPPCSTSIYLSLSSTPWSASNSIMLTSCNASAFLSFWWTALDCSYRSSIRLRYPYRGNS